MNRYRYCPLATASRREIGLRSRCGDTAGLHHSLASNIKVLHTWDPRNTVKHSDNGGVFNFDFSKDGSILGVACERKSVLLFDPFNGKLIASKYNAHTDCVNCVKFLDDRMFATCSDDTTVALWDVRYLKHTVQVFRGHSNWVKNIEYDAGGGKLVTSGFDGCIYTWDINSYTSDNRSNRVFYTSGLMRSKLFPDATKLLISTHEGYIIVIHDLDLSTLDEDLKGFKPNMYRLMQRTKTPLRIGLMYNHVFEQKRNRVEFISDWPTGNDANIISSLQVHPQGWCIASRNTDSSENTEWTCVHEIQTDPLPRKKPRPWEVEAPHTSSSYCSSTNTPAFSSVAPSHLHRINELMASDNIQRSDAPRNSQDISEVPRSSGESSRASRSARESSQDSRCSIEDSHHSQDMQTYRGNRDNTHTHVAVSGNVTRDSQVGGNDPNTELTNGNSTDPNTGANISSPNVHERNTTQVGGLGSEHASTNDSAIDTNGAGREPSSVIGETTSEESAAGGEIHRSSMNPNSGQLEERVEEEPNSSRVHNALIQIRRGPRGTDGNFSLSISVHTARGQTIEFNQSELESEDDEDNDYVIEQIISGADTDNDPTSSELQRQYFSRLIQRHSAASENQNRTSSGPNTSNNSEQSTSTRNPTQQSANDGGSDDSSDDSGSDYDAVDPEWVMDFGPSDQSGVDELEDEFDLSGGIQENFRGMLQDSLPSLRQQLYVASAGPHPPDLQQDFMDAVQSAQQDLSRQQAETGSSESAQQRASQSRATAVNYERTRVGLQDDNESGDESDNEAPDNQTSSSNPPASTGSGLDSRPRPNTVTFLIGPTQQAGERRRRVVNLSYMDSYTERENGVLQSKIYTNENRLKAYIEECNQGRGFIKELAFSADGRLISSPFAFGFRILAFDSSCNELCDCVPDSPVKLYEVASSSLGHTMTVVATKFSPTHNLVVSGCLNGKIAFHQPVL